MTMPLTRRNPRPESQAPTRSIGGVNRGLAWTGIVVLAVYLVFLGGAWVGVYLVKLRVVSLILTGVVLATWAAIAVRSPAWRPRTVLWPAFGAALVAFVIGEVASRQPRLGADYLAYAVLLTALYLLLQRSSPPRSWSTNTSGTVVERSTSGRQPSAIIGRVRCSCS